MSTSKQAILHPALPVSPFPVIEIEGDAYECGLGHGRLAAQRIARTIEIYLPAFLKQTGLSLDGLRDKAREYGRAIEAIDAGIMRELEGIAAGSGQKLEDIIAINCRTELLYGGLGGAKPATECTTIVALPEATRDGNILVGKNWDWRNTSAEVVVVLKVRQSGKPAMTLVVEAGMVGRDGYNEDGIVLVGNLLTSTEDHGQIGVPIPILRRRILNARHYYEAIELLVRSARGASSNYVVAHSGGMAIDFEMTPLQAFPVYPERGLLTHSNHFQSLVAQTKGVSKFYTGDSLYRDFRARQLLEPKIGQITVDDIKSVLRDHFGLPRSICRHPHDYPGAEPTMTIASLIFDPVNDVVHIAAGQPCACDYVRVSLPERPPSAA